MVSIIIPTLNRVYQLLKTLDSINNLNVDYNLFEVIIVDNGSTDTTANQVQYFHSSKCNFSLFYFYDNTPGLLTGRHLGASKANGSILTFIDDDVLVSTNWLNSIISATTNNNKFDLFTGPIFPYYEYCPPNWLEYFFQKSIDGNVSCGWLSLAYYGDNIKEINPQLVWGLNFTIRKSVFFELGGFNPDNIISEYQHFQGDGETGLSLKAIKFNKKALYHPGILIHHQISANRMTIDYFEKRAFYQGICNSFSFLRNIHLFHNSNDFLTIKKKLSLRKRLHIVKRFMVRYFSQYQNKNESDEKIQLIQRFNSKYKEGYDFHQNSFKNNPLVKEWVLKEDYLDYKLPLHD